MVKKISLYIVKDYRTAGLRYNCGIRSCNLFNKRYNKRISLLSQSDKIDHFRSSDTEVRCVSDFDYLHKRIKNMKHGSNKLCNIHTYCLRPYSLSVFKNKIQNSKPITQKERHRRKLRRFM